MLFLPPRREPVMRSTAPALVTGILFAIAVTHTVPARASWPADGLHINSLAPPTEPYLSFPFASDGAGGLFMKWNANLQRISPDGVLLFGAGLPLGSEADCAADGAGGLFVIDLVGFTLSLLRIDSAGNVMWTANACTTTYPKSNAHVSSDGAGGALVAWSEARPLPVPDDKRIAYCQRIDGNGNRLWADTGVLARKAKFTPQGHGLPPDEGVDVYVRDVCQGTPGGVAGGGFVLASIDPPTLNNTAYDSINIISAAGTLTGQNGAPDPSLFAIPDGSGGIYVSIPPANGAYLAAGTFNLATIQPISRYSQNGTFLWAADLGVPSLTRHGAAIAMTSGGIIAAWIQDSGDVYAQKFNESGVPQWDLSGVPVCTVAYSQQEAVVATDFAGGAYVAWSDGRYGESDLYLEHLDATGAPTLGGDHGIPITSQVGNEVHTTLYTDPAGYLIVAWNGAGGNFAQRFEMSTVSVAISSFTARAHDGHVVLEAELRSNLQVHGVKIYRATGDNALLLLQAAGTPDAQRFRYEDASVLPGTRYRYQLAMTDADGEFLSPIVELTTAALTTELRQNQPNPFNPETAISFTLEKSARASVQIYAADGARVRTLLDEARGAGTHRVTWNGRDDNGQPVSSGIYFYRLTADKFSATRKMVLLK